MGSTSVNRMRLIRLSLFGLGIFFAAFLQNNDGFEQLPLHLRALSYSTLVNLRFVHPATASATEGVVSAGPSSTEVPAMTVNWGIGEMPISENTGGEYGAVALFSALTHNDPPQLSLSRSIDGGVTWSDLGNTPAIPGMFNDREYLWAWFFV